MLKKNWMCSQLSVEWWNALCRPFFLFCFWHTNQWQQKPGRNLVVFAYETQSELFGHCGTPSCLLRRLVLTYEECVIVCAGSSTTALSQLRCNVVRRRVTLLGRRERDNPSQCAFFAKMWVYLPIWLNLFWLITWCWWNMIMDVGDDVCVVSLG